jgi:hypothetical protein
MEQPKLFLLHVWCSCYTLSSATDTRGAPPPPPGCVWCCSSSSFACGAPPPFLSNVCVVLLLFLLCAWLSSSSPPGCVWCCCCSSSPRMHMVLLLLLLPDARGATPLPPPRVWRTMPQITHSSTIFGSLRRPWSKMGEANGAVVGDVFR